MPLQITTPQARNEKALLAQELHRIVNLDYSPGQSKTQQSQPSNPC
jgi:hypothetical protein